MNAFELGPLNQRGNLGRNTLIGPGVVNFDGSLAKSFDVGEGKSLQFGNRDIQCAESSKFRRALTAHRIYERDGRAVSDRGSAYVTGDAAPSNSIRIEADVLSKRKA